VGELAGIAEAERSESDTHRAASVASALTTWGYDSAEAAAGYQQALDEPIEPTTELDVAVALARWLARLHVEDFDASAWAALQRQLIRLGPLRQPRLSETWRVAFGASSSSSMLRVRCVHCGADRYFDTTTGADQLSGTYDSDAEASSHAVASDNTAAFECLVCAETSWAAFVDRRS